MLTLKALRAACGLAVVVTATTAAIITPASAHHSFGGYDASVTKVFTGVVARVNPDANHLQIFFAVMNDERKNVIRGEDGQPIIWAVEMAGSAASAEQGISVNTFPPRTIFSVGLHPLRNGDPAGSREGAIVKCPAEKPPEAGKHCDTVEGSVFLGGQTLAAPVEGETVAEATDG
jgi:hypothetical protein